MITKRKVVIIGCGLVGSTSAFCLMESGLFSDMVLIDSDKKRAEGEAMDISHGIPFCDSLNIYAGDYDDIVDASLIIITAGANQKPSESRLELLRRNIDIFGNIIPEISYRNYDGLILVVTNPVDILTYVTLKLSGLPSYKVIGSGTVLDTARLRYELSEHLSVDSKSIHAFIIGEHGDSEIPVWSCANVSGVPLYRYFEANGRHNYIQVTNDLADKVKNSAYEIIDKKRATYYGIAVAVRRICEAIVRDEKSILPVSTLLTGHLGISSIALSVPCIVGKDGIEDIVELPLNEMEATAIRQSADMLKYIVNGLEI